MEGVDLGGRGGHAASHGEGGGGGGNSWRRRSTSSHSRRSPKAADPPPEKNTVAVAPSAAGRGTSTLRGPPGNPLLGGTAPRRSATQLYGGTDGGAGAGEGGRLPLDPVQSVSYGASPPTPSSSRVVWERHHSRWVSSSPPLDDPDRECCDDVRVVLSVWRTERRGGGGVWVWVWIGPLCRDVRLSLLGSDDVHPSGPRGHRGGATAAFATHG